MNLWRVRVLVVLLALRAVLQLLPADVADAERRVVEIALVFVLETARVLATAGVLVAVVIYVQVVLADVPVHAMVLATQGVRTALQGARIHVMPVATETV